MAAPTTTRSDSHTALAVLAAAALLGVLADVLFRGSDGPAINLPIWIATLAGTAGIIGARSGRAAPAGRWLLIGLGFASCFAIRRAEFLLVLDFFAMVLALALPGLALAHDLVTLRLRQYVAGIMTAGALVPAGAPILVARDAEWPALTGRGARIGQLAFGVILAVPVLLVFGALFSSADPAFKALVTALFDWDFNQVGSHIFVAGLFAWLAAGLLRGWLWSPAGVLKVVPPGAPAAAPLPVAMAVGAMALTFTAFVALQARWMFGGAALVERVTGLSYAEYARSGFFQMVAASGLAIPVLYGAEVLLDGSAPETLAKVRNLGRVQLLLIGVVMFSALSRMLLYMSVYGLTQDRITCIAIIGWLACVCAWFPFTVLRGRRERFTYGALTSGFAVLAALNAVNPEALIARVNSARIIEGRQGDVAFLATLSADAAPALAQQLGRLPVGAERCKVAQAIQKNGQRASDWRSWSLSRSRAGAAALAVDLPTLGCMPPSTTP